MYLFKYHITLLIIMLCGFLKAQNYAGITFSPYAGILTINDYPSNLATSPYKLHTNLLSTSLGLTAEAFDPTRNQLLTLTSGNQSSIIASTESQNAEFFVTGEIGLPSISFRINDKSGIAFNWKMRGAAYGRSTLRSFNIFASEGINADELYNLPVLDNTFGVMNTWQEYALSYGRRIINHKQHHFDIGAGIKYLRGGVSGYIEFERLKIDYDSDNNQINNIDGDLTMVFNNEFESIYEEQSRDIFNSSGFGGGFNISYEYSTPRTEERVITKKGAIGYLVKVASGFSDIGSISFKPATESGEYTLGLSEPIDAQYFNEIETPNEAKTKINETFALNKSEDSKYKMRLPTSWNFLIDYNIHSDFYLSYASRMTAVDIRTNYFSSTKMFDYKFGMRYEKSLYGIYLQIGHHDYFGFNTAFGARFSFLYMGLSNITSALSNNSSRSLGVHFSLNVPIRTKPTYSF